MHAEAEEEAEARMGIHMSECGPVHAETEEKPEARRIRGTSHTHTRARARTHTHTSAYLCARLIL